MVGAFSQARELRPGTVAARKIKRTLLFVAPSLGGGGAERVLLTILRNLDRERFDLSLAVVDGRAPAYLAELPDDVAYIDLDCRRVRYCGPRIVSLIRKRRPDVVLSTIGHLNLMLALLKPLLPNRTRLIARETSVVKQALGNSATDRVFKLAYRHLYRRFDRVVCQSEVMKQELVENFNVRADRARVIANPVDLARVQSLAAEPLPATARLLRAGSAHDIRLVAAGRLAWEKGFDLAIEALTLLPDSVSLTILGEGPLRNALEQQVISYGLEHRVQFLGFQSNPYAFFAKSSALLLSSRHESFPNVVLEALACGSPVIATPAAGGTAELVHGNPACLLADEVSAQSLARAITSFNFDQARACVPSMVEHAPHRIVAEYAALFDAV